MNGRGVTPDIMAVAKGIGGGFPLGACLATAEAAKGMTAGTHGTTFGGNPLAMAVGNAVLDVVLAPGFLEHVRADGPAAQAAARRAQGQPSGRHRGDPRRGPDARASRLTVPNTDFVAAARDRAAARRSPAGDNVVRLLPPLIVTEAEIGEAIEPPRRAPARPSRPSCRAERAARSAAE